MKRRGTNLLEREGARSVLASVISIVIGMLVGSLLILAMGLFNSGLSLASAWDGIRLVFGGLFSTGRSASGPSSARVFSPSASMISVPA